MSFSTSLIRQPESLLNFKLSKRVPTVLQAECTECGLACLAMVAGYHGYDVDMIALRRRFSVSSHGTSMRQIISMAGRLQLSSRLLRLEVEEIQHLQLPSILHWDMNHFVVLTKVKKNSVVINDPASGERVLTKEQFSQSFTGIALELSPTDAFEKKKDKTELKISHFWTRIVGLKRSLLQLFVLSLLLQLFAIITPFYMQTAIDDIVFRKDTNLLLVLAFGFFLLLMIQVATSTLREVIILKLSTRLSMQMSSNLFRHLIRLPLDYFSRRHMGDVVSRFSSLASIRDLLTTSLISAMVDGFMVIITLSAMFFYSVKLTGIVLIIVCVYGAIRWGLYRPFRLLSEEFLVSEAKESSHFMESVRAIQTIKLFQGENLRQNEWQNRLADSINKNIRISQWTIGYNTINGVLFGLENILIVYFAAIAVMENSISVGMLFAFVAYKTHFIASADNLITKWIELKMLGLHLDRLSDITFTQAEDVDSYLDKELSLDQNDDLVAKVSTALEGSIEVKNLSFRYSESSPFLFENLNFVIEKGESVVITGPSGCGKTTLLKIMMGLLQPTSGTVLIDDIDVTKSRRYRSQIASVMQDDDLLSGSIADNISCFSASADMNKVMEFADMACIHNEIMHMTMQYNTLVGDMGSSLSGGQKQRVILARALYRTPRILFMDEATSHLDVNNEIAINNNIKNLNITRVMVAHRMETVNSAGREIALAAE
ncbi:peptidase domain-containing ABC transporter [Teredinibacter sp. KSP-S5-2]|uniref:peptidase domain-containing ABC transporter n=1 Tax=Teredinibacter sp. KSP-S5-2 TaxID=3034506 RepID=UPI002934D3E2|nr:peptidase domain-containing ABC transporter [Teredinibacter sp. KSP-S5-2]WNO07794.1 peptidase domain-containing ABC transporter [Teredinibacter sp. KSP-S5-2]